MFTPRARVLAVALLTAALAAGMLPLAARAAPAADVAIRFALDQVGKPYAWGGTGPGAYDCSGLVYAAYGEAGVRLPRSSSAMHAALPAVSRADLRPGDLVFHYRPVSHVGIYLGGGKMVNAQTYGKPVAVEAVNWDVFSGAARPAEGAPSRSAVRTAPAGDGLLETGDRGSAVARWQRQLNAVRRRDIAADGIFGPVTHAATRSFQRSAGITVDGVVGPQTRAAMRAAVDGGNRRSRRVSRSGDRGSSGLLETGDRGSAVARWQRQLNAVRRRDIAADGIFGPVTHAATRSFQRSAGITVDGIVGPRTRAAMRSAR